MVERWELDKVKGWTTDELKNRIWLAIDCDQPVPGCVSVEAMRQELVNRGEEPAGYHNT